MDVGIHREEEPGRGEAALAPEAEVEVLRPDDPSEEEVRPLAGAPVAGRRKEEEETARRGARGDVAPLPHAGEETLEGRDVVRPAVVPGREERGEGAVDAKRRPDGPKKGAKGSGIDPPVDEPVEARGVPGVPGDGGGGGRPEGGEEALERVPDRADPAEGEGGGQEGDDLAVGRNRIAMRELEGIGVEPPAAPLGLEETQALPEERDIRTARPTLHRLDPIRPGSRSDPPDGVGW